MDAARLLSDDDESLLRQVHPNFMRDGRPSSQAWKPMKKDEGLLSVARGALSDPKAAFEHHTQVLGLTSAGTWSVSVGECAAEDLKAYSDPLEATSSAPADPAHAVIDFTSLSNSRVEAKATRLGRCASARGCLHSPSKGAAGPEAT
jgi:hypothetical protein